MVVRVRQLESKDRAAWEPLFRGYLEFYESRLTDEMIAMTWGRLLDEAPEFHTGLVAVGDDDVPIGLAHILFHRSTWSPAYYCYLEDLFVAPDRRLKGVGRALIEATYAEADKRGCTRTYWATQEFNYRGRALYDQVATKSPFIQYRR